MTKYTKIEYILLKHKKKFVRKKAQFRDKYATCLQALARKRHQYLKYTAT